MASKALPELKRQLKRKYGSLRAAAHELKISSWRLSSIIGGWISPNEEELKKLKLGKYSSRDKRGVE